MAAEPDAPSFVAAFTDWVEAAWFGEQEEAARSLDAVLGLRGEVVLSGAVSILSGLFETFWGPTSGADIAAALADHLIIGRSDPEREALIGDVVRLANSRTAPATRAELLDRHGAAAITRAALECASFLAQVVAEREGVVPSVILEDL